MNPKSTLLGPEVIKLNDSLYQLHRPAGARRMLVVFFHGFQLEDYANAHWKTWTSRDGSIWPQTWLAEKFPEAHVLSVSYNRWMTNDRDRGTMDVFNICENLKTDLLRTNGKKHRCPIILVGHSFGGLLIKELCVHVSNNMGWEPNPSTKSSLKDFLKDLKGIFFYGTPHRGIREKALTAFTAENQSLREYVKVLSTPAVRTESPFSGLSEKYNWQIGGLGESLPIEKSGFSALGVGVETVGVVTPEASSRYGLTYNTAENTDHITITRPKATTERTFTALVDLLSRIEAKGLDVGRPVHQSQGIPEYHAGLGRSSHDVVKKLVNMEKLKNARVLGIVGMGGIGKTTIAKAVFNKISKEFEYTCFLDNVKEIEIRQLEHQVLRDFYHHGMPLEQKDAHWSTLKGKKTLMVMDDVKSKGQLRKLPKQSDFGAGSRLIITSRDKSVLAFYAEYDVYEVDFLRDREAREFFCQCAFGLRKIPQGSQHLEADVTRVLKKCQGLPLTLELVGSYLKGHVEAEFWDETIENLGNVQDVTGDQENTLRASLNISYESLGPIEREIFLEAATCFFQQPLERALAVWKTNHGRSSTGWENLLNKSMVKQVRKTKWKIDDSFGAFRGIEYMEVWVHEHFRDWAKKESGRRMLIGVDEDADRAIDLLKADEVNFGAGKETLRVRDGRQQTQLQLNLLDKLENLKYLELEGISHEGSTKTCPRLSILRWNYCHDVVNVEQMKCFDFQVLPLNVKQMNNLAVLELSKMKIPEEFPEALENLVNLRILSLSFLGGVDRLPERFGNLSSLKQLELEGLHISALPDSFCALSTLTDLSIVSCSSLQALPESFGKLSRLEYMWIVKCSILERLPDSFGDLKLLKDLCISGCRTLEVQPKNFRCLLSLERFQLDSCSLSSRLPNLEELKSLLFVMLDGVSLNLSMQPKKLWLSGLTREKLSAIFGVLSALEDLVVDSSGLRRLPENLSSLSTLKRLTLLCGGLEELPEKFGNLCALTDLTLECRNLERLPESFKHLSSLERLEINGCAKLRELPSVSEFTALRRLKIDGQVFEQFAEIGMLTVTGQTLELLSAKFRSLSALKDLDVFDHWALKFKRLPKNLGILSTLQRLTIRCADLKALPENLGNLFALTHLTLRCPRLERLPESFKRLSCLERLVIDGCWELELLNISELRCLVKLTIDGQVLEDVHNLSARKKLTVAGETLNILSPSFEVLSTLEDLEVVDGRRLLERLPENFGTLATLQRLTIRCADLKALPENLGNLSALTDLTLRCPRLERLPESFKRLSSLERLEIDGCWELELPNVSELACLVRLTIDGKILEELSAIERLTLSGETLKKLSASFGVLSALEDLEVVDGWQQLKRLPENLGTLATLQRLTIQCADLRELPENLGYLSVVTDLTLRCPRLRRLPESFRRLSCLERLEIDGCWELELPNVSELACLVRLTIDGKVLEELSAIKRLTLSGETLKKLSASFGVLSTLQDLEVVDGGQCLERLPENLGTLATLQRLTIRCADLRELPENLGNLSALTDLTLWCLNLERLPESFKRLSCLERLEIDGCWELELLENLGTLATLQRLTIRCADVRELPENLGNLSALTDLTLRCPSLKRLPESFKHLSCLERLEINGCWELELPHVSELRCLVRLTIDRQDLEDFHNLSARKRLTAAVGALKNLSASFGILSALEDLEVVESRGHFERLPENLGTLSTLQRLTIRCAHLKELPENLGNLSALTDLTLECPSLRRLPDSLRHLSCLETLVMDGCWDLELVENLGNLKTLQTLTIRCADLKELPENLGNLSALTDLTLQCRSLKRLPESFKHLSCLERLVINGCSELELPHVSKLRCLVRLTIDGQDLEDSHSLSARKKLTVLGGTLKNLSASFGIFSALEDLEVVDGWRQLKRLPENLGTLSTLQRLRIRCANLEELPENLGNLSALTDLTLQCRSLKRLPESFKDLSCLERLEIDGCWELELPHVSELRCLVRLTIDRQDLEDSHTLSARKKWTVTGGTLKNLSASFGILSALEDLEVVESRGHLERLPENLGTLSTLQRLMIRCADLEELPENLGNLSALTDLTLQCRSLKRLPESFKHLSCLERLEIDGCWELELPHVSELRCLVRLTIDRQDLEDFHNLSARKKLTVAVVALKNLSASFGIFSALEDLEVVDGCPQLKRLPENLGTLSTLQRLTIRCAYLEELPENLGNLSALTDLTLQCPRLRRLPDSLRHLSCLETLVIDGCWDLELVEDLGNLKTLQRLTIRCADLVELPENLGNLSALTDLTLRCRRLERLPESFKRLSCLERLEIYVWWELDLLEDLGTLTTLQTLTIRCADLEELPENLGNLSALTDLTLGCPSLKRLPDSFKHLACLERLVIDGCGELELRIVSKLRGLVRLTINGQVFEDFDSLLTKTKLTVAGVTLKLRASKFWGLFLPGKFGSGGT